MRDFSLAGVHSLNDVSVDQLVAEMSSVALPAAFGRIAIHQGLIMKPQSSNAAASATASGADGPARTTRTTSSQVLTSRLSSAAWLLVILALMIVVFWRLEPAFANPRNMFSILEAVSVTALLALGVTVTLAIAGFDLSIGSTAAMSLMASSYAMVILNQGTVVAVVVCLLLGILIGYLNGVLIVHGRIPDLLATLGMMFLLLGLQLIRPEDARSPRA